MGTLLEIGVKLVQWLASRKKTALVSVLLHPGIPTVFRRKVNPYCEMTVHLYVDVSNRHPTDTERILNGWVLLVQRRLYFFRRVIGVMQLSFIDATHVTIGTLNRNGEPLQGTYIKPRLPGVEGSGVDIELTPRGAPIVLDLFGIGMDLTEESIYKHTFAILRLALAGSDKPMDIKIKGARYFELTD